MLMDGVEDEIVIKGAKGVGMYKYWKIVLNKQVYSIFVYIIKFMYII